MPNRAFIDCNSELVNAYFVSLLMQEAMEKIPQVLLYYIAEQGCRRTVMHPYIDVLPFLEIVFRENNYLILVVSALQVFF